MSNECLSNQNQSWLKICFPLSFSSLSLSLSIYVSFVFRLTYFTNCVDARINLKLNSHSRRPFYSSCEFPSQATHGRFCHSGIWKYLFCKTSKNSQNWRRGLFFFPPGLWSLCAAGSYILGLLLAQQRGHLRQDIAQ